MSKRKIAKKKGPWVPGKEAIPLIVAQQLGLPRERFQHGDFESEPVGIGHNRLRERSMLTHPALLAERYNLKMRSHIEAGKDPDQFIQIQQTPSDRATAMWRHLLWQYMITVWEEEPGKAGSTNFEKSSHSSELYRLPLSENQFNRRKFVGWLKKQPGGICLTNYLNKVAAQCHPQAYNQDYTIMSKAEIGMWRIDTDNSRDAKNAADGALAQACEHLAEMAAAFVAQERVNRKSTSRKPN